MRSPVHRKVSAQDVAPTSERILPPSRARFRLGLSGICLVACIFGLLAACGWVLKDSRDRTQALAEQNQTNMTDALADNVRHDFESLARSIDGTVRALRLPGIWDLSSELQQVALYDDASTRSLTPFVVLAKDGRLLSMSGNPIPPAMDFSDKSYFKYHQDHADMSVHLTGPAIDASGVVVMSRRVNDDHGNFYGVVAGGIYTSRYTALFNQIALGNRGVISLISGTDGIIARVPPDPRTSATELIRAPVFTYASRSPSGTYIGVSMIDREERLVTYRAIDGYPLVIAVARSVREIFEGWRRLASLIGTALIVLSVVSVVLLQKFLKRSTTEQYARASADALLAANRSLKVQVDHEVRARQEAMEQLAAGRRLEALGQLAGGIAHDINNVLQTISGACSLLQSRARPNDDVSRLTSITLSAADRGSAIVRRLLVFARRAVIKPESVDTKVILRDLQEVLNHTLGGSVVVELDLAPTLSHIMVDKMQLETVIINLATNARDAMAGGGVITISAAMQDRASSADCPKSLADGRYVRLSVADVGTGMDETLLARAAEPFFTTKGVGKGSGLGLSMAKGFAEQAKGAFGIQSKQGVGTTVTLWLPVDDAVDEIDDPTPQPATGRRPIVAEASILVVDDNRQLRELVAEWLIASGKTVHQAHSGEEAIAKLSAGLTPDLLLTDLAMPRMNGLELIRAARRKIPDLPSIILTGNSGAVANLALEEVIGGNCSIIQKPVRVADLSDSIDLLLQKRTRPTASALLGITTPSDM